MVKILINDRRLVLSFIEREAEDFKPANPRSWAEDRLSIIEHRLEDYEGANYIIFTSQNRNGGIIRQLKVETQEIWRYNPDTLRSIEVVLCNCGKLSCWGQIFLKKKGDHSVENILDVEFKTG